MKKTNSASKTRKSLEETKLCEESGDKAGISPKLKAKRGISLTYRSLGICAFSIPSYCKSLNQLELCTLIEPLPMKMRAFPQSFWQEPNASGIVLPTTCCSPLEDERDQKCHSQVLGKANTDLLFSLFQNVNRESEKKVVPVVKRGRYVEGEILKWYRFPSKEIVFHR